MESKYTLLIDCHVPADVVLSCRLHPLLESNESDSHKHLTRWPTLRAARSSYIAPRPGSLMPQQHNSSKLWRVLIIHICLAALWSACPPPPLFCCLCSRPLESPSSSPSHPRKPVLYSSLRQIQNKTTITQTARHHTKQKTKTTEYQSSSRRENSAGYIETQRTVCLLP